MPIRPLCLCWRGSHFFLFNVATPIHPSRSSTHVNSSRKPSLITFSLCGLFTSSLCFYSILYLWAQKKNTSMIICIWFLFGLPGFRSRLNFTILFCLMLLSDHCLKQCPAGFILYSDISTIYYFIYKYKYIYKICTYIKYVNIYIYFFSVYQREQKSQEHDISAKG